jgi:hypothetical protein
MDTKTYIKTMGNAKAYIQQGMQRESNEVNWNVDYDGRDADIDLDIGRNGEMSHYKAVLSNEDLANILNIPAVNVPLENRLQNDFLVDRRVYKLEPVPHPLMVVQRKKRQYKPPIRIVRTRRYKRRPRSSTSFSKSSRSKATSRPKTMRIRFNNTSHNRRKNSSSSSRRRSSTRRASY